VFAPIEFSGINDDTRNGGAVASNPLRGRVDNNICTVIDRTNKVSTSSEGVVNLED
jgi:hypothetical protein